MPCTPYRLITAEQAAAALEEFRTERSAALERLHPERTIHGTAPDTLLGSQGSTVGVVAEPASFDVGLHAVIADRSSHPGDRTARALAGLHGISSVHRSAPDALRGWKPPAGTPMRWSGG